MKLCYCQRNLGSNLFQHEHIVAKGYAKTGYSIQIESAEVYMKICLKYDFFEGIVVENLFDYQQRA